MGRLAFLMSFLAFYTSLFSKLDVMSISAIKPDSIAKVYITKLKPNQIYVPMDFKSNEVKDISALREIKGITIMTIEVVYSSFVRNDAFNQNELNKKRLESLELVAPYLFEFSFTKYAFIAQTDWRNEDDAKDLFHGVIVTYRKERGALDSISQKKLEDFVKWFTTKKDRPSSLTKEDINYFMRDTLVLSVLTRTKEWKNMALVCDVTGSMYPFMSQVMVWLKLNCESSNLRYYTFFNDGDNKRDDEKIIGNTGGIYHGLFRNYKHIDALMKEAMRKGGGGDSPENNIEAILSSIDYHKEVKEIIMIADNYANIKDIKLLNKIKIPVNIILCGSSFGINVDYLNLAKKTGGKIYTIEQDLLKLMDLNEGETFKFKNEKFIIEKGVFRKLYS